MTDSSIPDVPAFADVLSPLERAKLGLQDELSVFEIGLLTFPEKADHQKQKRLADLLLQAIKTGRLAAYGNPDGWDVQSAVDPPGAYEENPWPRCKPHTGTRITRGIRPGYRSRYAEMRWDGDNCLIQRADYLAILATPAAVGIPKPDWWQAPQGEPAPLPQIEPGKPGSGAAESPKRKRVDALGEAIEAALEVLSPDGRLPTPALLFEYLLTQDKTGVVTDSSPDGKLLWVDSNGSPQKATVATLSKRLDRIEKRSD